MKKKTKMTTEEHSLFKTAMKDVNPLQQGEFAPPHKNIKKPVKQQAENDRENINYYLSDAQDYQFVQSHTNMSYTANGVQTKLFKKLRLGKLPIEARLDLHGLTINQSRQQVSDFIYQCGNTQKKCVIIIHGKGTIENPAKLKSMVYQWLQQIPSVLAFHTTQAMHGGKGAVYVLIKNQPKIDSLLKD